MTQSHHNEPIRYRHQEFAINRLIDDCPPQTVIRELVKNAEENATLLNPIGKIEWFTEQICGVPKLGLFNEGPGMAPDVLSRLMDLASTGKTLGRDNNFGQGGKISALKASPHGVIFRSCTQGRVSQIVLAAEDRPDLGFPVYVKKCHTSNVNPDEGTSVGTDVTDQFLQRCERRLNRDWTEVVLLGNNEAHNTVTDLFPEKNWLMRLINMRFFRFPEGVNIRGADLFAGPQTDRHVSGLEALTEIHSEKTTDVSAEHPRFGPVTIRYCRLRGRYGENEAGQIRAKKMEAHGLGSRGDHICLVWRNECYDVHAGWARVSGAFGVTFGSSNVAIQILLPDQAPVKNNTYRDAILERAGNQQRLQVEDFADLVRGQRPKWLKDYVEREAQKNTCQGDVNKRLKALMENLKAPGEKRFEVMLGGDNNGEVARRTKRGTGESSDEPYAINETPSAQTKPAKGQPSSRSFPGIPQVAFAEDPAILEEMVGRAGMYNRQENAVLLNPRHFKYKEDLNKIYRDVGPGGDRRSLAKVLFDEEYFYNAGKFVILAWLFKDKDNWGELDWQQALTPVSLSVHLAEPTCLENARKRLRQKLNSRKFKNEGAK